jgi:hypothetical protein
MSQTLTGVPIVETGIEYPTSTGPVTFTAEDLAHIVESQSDPAIVSPRLKLGHSDTRFSTNSQDGEPAFGVVKNMSLANNGNTVVADYVGVPDWLAEILPTAYPSRSIEGNFDVETVTGHKWRFVVTDVALLGVVWPGISTLDDLQISLSDTGPEGVTMAKDATVLAETVSDTPWSNFSDADYTDAQYTKATVYDRGKCNAAMKDATAKQRYSLPVREPSGALNRNGVHAAAGRVNQVTGGCSDALKAAATTLVNMYKNSLKEDPPASLTSLAATLEASTNAEDVRRSFYDTVATQDNDQYWWWIRALLLDPNELIVDDDDGGLYRIPFNMGENDVTFSDPIPVKIQYVDQPATAASFAGAVIASVYTTSESSRPDTRVRSMSTVSPSKVTANINLNALRKRLGLPDNATEDEINSALENEPTLPETPESDPMPADGGSEAPRPPSEGTDEPPTSATAASRGDTVVVDRDTFAQMQSDAALGRQAYDRQQSTDRDNYLSAAVQQGKFAPARIDHWRNAWNADPEGTKATVDSLAAGLIPVGQLGAAPNEEGEGNTNTYPAHLFPELQRKRQPSIIQES